MSICDIIEISRRGRNKLRGNVQLIIELIIITRNNMSNIERHLRMFEKLGLRSNFFLLNTNTQRMFPKNNTIKHIIMEKCIAVTLLLYKI